MEPQHNENSHASAQSRAEGANLTDVLGVLLKCQFCGSEPMIYEIEPHAHAISLGDFKMPDHPGSAVIECGCGAGLIDDTRELVTKRWNTRAPNDKANSVAEGDPVEAEGRNES